MKNGLLIEIELKKYYKDDLLHREDGPAVECVNGDKEWYQNGDRHREDGPAIEPSDGSKFYYYFHKEIKASSLEEFKRYIELLTFK